MMPAGTQILVLKEGTRRDRGKGAQFNNIAAAKAVADAVRSTLGPRGMDKMLVDSLGDVVITNDGVTILKEIDIDAKIEITDPAQLQAFLNEEESMLKRMVEIVKKSGATVIFCQKGIDDLAQHYLAKADIYAVRRVKKSDMKIG